MSNIDKIAFIDNLKIKFAAYHILDTDMVLINGWNEDGQFYWDYITFQDYEYDYKQWVDEVETAKN